RPDRPRARPRRRPPRRAHPERFRPRRPHRSPRRAHRAVRAGARRELHRGRARAAGGVSAAARTPRRKHLMAAAAGDRHRWIALSNTTMAVFMSALDGSIVIISLPAIFRGIHLDPLAPANISYLLWMIMGYRLVQAVLVVTVGRIGDMYGRVRIYN